MQDVVGRRGTFKEIFPFALPYCCTWGFCFVIGGEWLSGRDMPMEGWSSQKLCAERRGQEQQALSSFF